MAEVTLTIDDANAAALLADHRIKVTEWTLERPSGELRIIAEVRPKLPNVGPSGVLRYTTTGGFKRRALGKRDQWSVYGPGGYICDLTDRQILEDVDESGFTVELEGL